MRRLNAAHALVSKARPTDATLEVFWLNPARSPLDAKLCLMLEPVALELQNTEEEALELIGRCRARARHNADLLEAYPDGVWLVELAAIAATGAGNFAFSRSPGMRAPAR